MKKLFNALLLASMFSAGSAYAGNIALTGHDDDFHGDTNALAQINQLINFVRAGSTLPILTFDAGAELTNALTSLGVSYVNVNPSFTIAASIFDHQIYSAFAVASDSTCGGCDNNAIDTANLIANSEAIKTFFNDGGGILAFAGAANAATYYGFLPASASGFGDPPSTGYVQTAFGASLGIDAVNGDPTHNFFAEPGTGGVSSAYGVVERFGTSGPAETIACASCTISGGTIIGAPGTSVPEPGTVTLFGIAAAGLIARRRFGLAKPICNISFDA